MTSRRPLFALLLSLGSLFSGLTLCELAVRLLENRASYKGQARSRYEEAYQAKAFRADGLGDAGFLAPGFSGWVTNEMGQPVPWVHNSLGFRRRGEIAREPAAGSWRILMVGDSFVVGHRLAQDNTVGAQLESFLAGEGVFPGAEVLIAAVEHPAKGLEYLERFGFAFKPKVVHLGLTLGNDLAQIYFTTSARGEYRLSGEAGVVANPDYDHAAALEAVRVQAIPTSALGPSPGETPWNAQPEPLPVERPLHLLSWVERALADRRERRRPQAILSTWGEYRAPRLFDGNGLGLYLREAPPEIEQAYERLEQVLLAYERLSRRHGARFVLAVHAQRFQIQPEDWLATVAAYGLNPQMFDLEAPNRRIAALCQRHGLICLDPTRAMAERYIAEPRGFFMPRGDMHWNTRGSRTYFELIRDPWVAALRTP